MGSAVFCVAMNQSGADAADRPSPKCSLCFSFLDHGEIAVEDGVVTEGRGLDLDGGADRRHAVLVDLLEDLLEEQIAEGFDDTAAVEDQVGAEGVCRRGRCPSERTA